MADDYRQYTSCSRAHRWRSMAAHLLIAGAMLAAAGIAPALLLGWCALIYIAVALAAESVAGCNWWLHVRLVCLGGDESAVGMLVDVHPSRGKSGFFNELDTDYSINLLLYPNSPGVTQALAEASQPYGRLIKSQPDVNTHVFEGVGEIGKDPVTGVESAVLHAEFEGGGVYYFRIGASVSLGLSLAALVACLAIPPPWGLAVAALLTFLAFLTWLFSYLAGSRDYAEPTDTKGTPSEFHTNIPDPNNPAQSLGADLLYVAGSWVFDSLHAGWNEIHPIKKCTRIGVWTGAWPTNTTALVAKYDNGFADARNPVTLAQQAQPTHQWHTHPMIDGCGTYPAPEVPVV